MSYPIDVSERDQVFDITIETEEVKPELSESPTYQVEVSEQDQTFSVSSENVQEIDAELSEAIQIVSTNLYQGEYIVIPKAQNEVVLETRNKTMADNVTVRKVPYYETSNITGETVYIATEV